MVLQQLNNYDFLILLFCIFHPYKWVFVVRINHNPTGHPCNDICALATKTETADILNLFFYPSFEQNNFQFSTQM